MKNDVIFSSKDKRSMRAWIVTRTRDKRLVRPYGSDTHEHRAMRLARVLLQRSKDALTVYDLARLMVSLDYDSDVKFPACVKAIRDAIDNDLISVRAA